MNTQPIRLPETEAITQLHLATVALPRIARELWWAVTCYNLEHPRMLPVATSQATVALYRAIDARSLTEQAHCLKALVDALGKAPRWIACARGIDEALGQAERFLRYAMLEETEEQK